MKIVFLIGNPPRHQARNWNEILKFSNDGPEFEKEFYQLIKALEQNEVFEDEVHKSRVHLNVPKSGYSWKEFQKLLDNDKKLHSAYLNSTKEIDRIRKKMSLNHKIHDYTLEDIIFTSSVSAQEYISDIHYWLEPDDRLEWMEEEEKEEFDEIPKSFNIAFTRQVSKNELINFINQNWEDFKESISKLPKKTKYFISERDLRIVELRDKKGLKYSEIADQIISEFSLDNMDGRVNEDSIKTSYARTKMKIVELSRSSGK